MSAILTEELRKFSTKKYQVTIEVIMTDWGCNWLRDLYTPSDKHIAGTTIQVPDYLQSRNCPEYYIGQTKPSELARDYAKQGRENPSKEAYESLQKELSHYILATDCYLQATVYKAGIELGTAIGTCFEYSDVYGQELEELGKEMLKEYGYDFVREAIKEARDTLDLLCN